MVGSRHAKSIPKAQEISYRPLAWLARLGPIWWALDVIDLVLSWYARIPSSLRSIISLAFRWIVPAGVFLGVYGWITARAGTPVEWIDSEWFWTITLTAITWSIFQVWLTRRKASTTGGTEAEGPITVTICNIRFVDTGENTMGYNNPILEMECGEHESSPVKYRSDFEVRDLVGGDWIGPNNSDVWCEAGQHFVMSDPQEPHTKLQNVTERARALVEGERKKRARAKQSHPA